MINHLDTLYKIKKLRFEEVTKLGRRDNLLRRAVRKFFELIKLRKGYHIIFIYYLQKAFIYSFASVHSILNKYCAFTRESRVGCKRVIAVKLAGGIGDVVVATRFLRDLHTECRSSIQIDVYFHKPDSIRFILGNFDFCRRIIDSQKYTVNQKDYLVGMELHQYPIITWQANSEDILVFNKTLLRVIKRIEANCEKYSSYISYKPALDGLFSDLAVRDGFNRETGLHFFAGIDYRGTFLPITSAELDFSSLGMDKNNLKYITIHDGWDANFKMIAERPTKSMPVRFWNDLCYLLKEKLGDDIKIVQLGGVTGANISNVDINLKGKLSLEESCRVISSSLLHIDTESGLVHLATSMGVPCTVLFGPTNLAYFGYVGNENIRSEVCGNCWWSTDAWMDLCPLNEPDPLCTKSINADYVASLALNKLAMNFYQ